MTTKAQKLAPLPDPPEGSRGHDQLQPDHITGNSHYLKDFLDNPETTLVAGEHYLARTRPTDMTGVRYPDLLVAFGVNPEAYYQANAYIIEEQANRPTSSWK